MKRRSLISFLHLYAVAIGAILGSLFWKITYLWAESRRAFGASKGFPDAVDKLMLYVLNYPDKYVLIVFGASAILAIVTVELFVFRKHLLGLPEVDYSHHCEQ